MKYYKNISQKLTYTSLEFLERKALVSSLAFPIVPVILLQIVILNVWYRSKLGNLWAMTIDLLWAAKLRDVFLTIVYIVVSIIMLIDNMIPQQRPENIHKILACAGLVHPTLWSLCTNVHMWHYMGRFKRRCRREIRTPILIFSFAIVITLGVSHALLLHKLSDDRSSDSLLEKNNMYVLLPTLLSSFIVLSSIVGSGMSLWQLRNLHLEITGKNERRQVPQRRNGFARLRDLWKESSKNRRLEPRCSSAPKESMKQSQNSGTPSLTRRRSSLTSLRVSSFGEVDYTAEINCTSNSLSICKPRDGGDERKLSRDSLCRRFAWISSHTMPSIAVDYLNGLSPENQVTYTTDGHNFSRAPTPSIIPRSMCLDAYTNDKVSSVTTLSYPSSKSSRTMYDFLCHEEGSVNSHRSSIASTISLRSGAKRTLIPLKNSSVGSPDNK